jgi:hypothetical protein
MNAPPPATDDPRLQQALAHLQSVLIPAETLEAWTVQRRLFALTHRRILVAATSGRLVAIVRRFLGGFEVLDLRWQDLESVGLKVGLFAAELTLRAGRAADLASEGASGASLLAFAGLRKESAQAVYRICQAQDQAWREKRRIRELEELRARSGGIQLAGGLMATGPSGAAPPAGAAPGAPSAGAGPAGAGEAVRRLQEARQMLEARLITDAEYEAIKARIVSLQ